MAKGRNDKDVEARVASSRLKTYLNLPTSKVDSGPITLKGGTNDITSSSVLGTAMNRIPVRKFSKEGTNFLDKPILSVNKHATKIPLARDFLVNGFDESKICDIHCTAGVETGCL